MNLLSVKRKGHGIDEWIRRETPNSRGLQLVKTQALLYNKYHYVLHNNWVLIVCSHTSISNPSKSSINIPRQKAIWKNSEMSNYCYFLGETTDQQLGSPTKCENKRILESSSFKEMKAMQNALQSFIIQFISMKKNSRLLIHNSGKYFSMYESIMITVTQSLSLALFMRDPYHKVFPGQSLCHHLLPVASQATLNPPLETMYKII